MKKLLLFLAIILTITILTGETGRRIYDLSNADGIFYKSINQPSVDIVQPVQNPIPSKIPVNDITGDLLIDDISRDMAVFQDKGWKKLYESGEFDCSRMATFMWEYLRNKYKIPPKLVVAPNREHAWIALRVVDVGDTERYEQWTIKNVSYYFLETTKPGIVKYEKDVYFGDKWYASNMDFYTTRTYIADEPLDANTLSGAWSTEFRLTKPDIDKLSTFK